MNGDVLTSLDYAGLFEATATRATPSRSRRTGASSAASTACCTSTDDAERAATQRVNGYEEKPEIPYTVSMGVYMLEPRALDHIPVGERSTSRTSCSPCSRPASRSGRSSTTGYWLDIGRHDDYEQALADYEQILPRLMP